MESLWITLWKFARPRVRAFERQNKNMWKKLDGFCLLVVFAVCFAALRPSWGAEALSDKSRQIVRERISDKSRQIVRERTHFFAPRAAILYLTKRGSAEGC